MVPRYTTVYIDFVYVLFAIQNNNTIQLSQSVLNGIDSVLKISLPTWSRMLEVDKFGFAISGLLIVNCFFPVAFIVSVAAVVGSNGYGIA